MALFDGKNFKGGIGNLSFRRYDEYYSSVQAKPGKGNVKQTENTKKSASLFGSLISPFAKHIRFHFRGLVNDFADRQMVNRMNSAIAIIINQHLELDRKIVFNSESFNRLKGFEFNVNSLLIDSLLTMPRISYAGEKVNINIPPFNAAKNIRFPENTYKVIIQIQPVFFKLSKGLGLRAQPYYVEIDKSTALTEESTFSYDFPTGSVCMIGLSLLFSSNQIAFNNKKFNPAGIVWASYKEGIADDENDGGWYNTGFRIDE